MIDVEALRTPWPKKLHHAKPGSGATYVHTAHYIDRLNAVFGVGGWGWRSSWSLHCEEVVVEGHLEVLDHDYPGWDAHPINKKRDGGSIPGALGDAIKGAESGALVRACRLLGIGLELWAEGGQEPLGGGHPRGASPPMTVGKELNMISSVAKALGWKMPELIEICGGDPRSFTPAEVRALLDRIHDIPEVAQYAEDLRKRAIAAASSLGWEPSQLREAVGLDVLEASTRQLLAASSKIAALDDVKRGQV